MKQIWVIATPVIQRGGHGEGSWEEVVVRRRGSWGEGEYPPAFSDPQKALEWIRALPDSWEKSKMVVLSLGFIDG